MNASSSGESTYYAGVDGLRAVAVVGVILYHAGLPWMRGGFLGVESFFVISGYLITTLLLADWRRLGRIDFARFWRRRVKRLLPAFVAAIVGTLAFVVVFVPDEVARLRGDVLPALAFLSNWQFIFTQQSYFEAAGRPPLLRHLWSLAIEWQFYVIWPVVCLALFRLGRRRAALAAFLGALASAGWMAVLYHPEADPSRVYFGTDTRAAGLLIGAALALLAPPSAGERARRALTLAGAAALAALLALYVGLDELNPVLYGGGFVVVSLLTAVTVAAATVSRDGRLARALGTPVLRWAGLRSYGLYLWHWPVFALLRPWVDVPLDDAATLALRLAITLALTELSYRCIETPVRTGALGRTAAAVRAAQGARRARLLAGAAAVTAVAVAALAGLALAAISAQPSRSADQLAANQLEVAGLLTPEAPVSWVSESHSDTAPAATPAQVEPATAPTDVAQPPAETPTPAVPAVPSPVQPDAPRDPIETAAARPRAGFPSSPAWPAPVMVVITKSVEGRVRLDGVRPLTDTRRRVFALGDSVMLGAARRMQEAFGDIDIDAHTARPFKEGLAMARERRDKGLLGEVVIVHLGNNGPISAAQFGELLDALSGVERVVLVNLRVPRNYEQANNALFRAASAGRSNVVLVDWNAVSVRQPGVLDLDGIHLRSTGVATYIDLLVKAASP